MKEPEKHCTRFLRGIREDWSRKRSYGSNTAMMTVFQRQGLLRSSKSPLVFDKQDAWFVDSAACCQEATGAIYRQRIANQPKPFSSFIKKKVRPCSTTCLAAMGPAQNFACLATSHYKVVQIDQIDALHARWIRPPR